MADDFQWLVGKPIAWTNCAFPDTESVITSVRVDGCDLHLTLANGMTPVITFDVWEARRG